MLYCSSTVYQYSPHILTPGAASLANELADLLADQEDEAGADTTAPSPPAAATAAAADEENPATSNSNDVNSSDVNSSLEDPHPTHNQAPALQATTTLPTLFSSIVLFHDFFDICQQVPPSTTAHHHTPLVYTNDCVLQLNATSMADQASMNTDRLLAISSQSADNITLDMSCESNLLLTDGGEMGETNNHSAASAGREQGVTSSLICNSNATLRCPVLNYQL